MVALLHLWADRFGSKCDFVGSNFFATGKKRQRPALLIHNDAIDNDTVVLCSRNSRQNKKNDDCNPSHLH